MAKRKWQRRFFTIENDYKGLSIYIWGLRIHFNTQNRDLINQLARIEQSAHVNHLMLDEILKNQILESSQKDFDNFGIVLCTDYPEAKDSNDNLYPESTMDGIIRKPRFSNRIKELFGENASLLDIGCGGGGIVYDALTKGIKAFGIDGSTANRVMQNGYWMILKDNLLTCDATQPFNFKMGNNIFRFKVISSWECLEHINSDNIPKFLENVRDNLDDDGYFIGSISRMPYEDIERGIVYHVTLKDKNWWKERFDESGFEFMDIEDSLFEYTDFCRGIGLGWQDEHTNYLKNTEDGFLFVAKKK